MTTRQSSVRSINMTGGAPLKVIIRFGLPLILANTLQQIYAMVDTVILGRFGGVQGLAALGTSSWPVWLSVSFMDVLWSNRDPVTDHAPHAWNAFQIMYQIGDAR